MAGKKKTEAQNQDVPKKVKSIPAMKAKSWIPEGTILSRGRPKIYTEEIIKEEADALLEWIKQPTSFYIGVFAAERGYDRARLSEFSRKDDYFSRAYDEAIQWQENMFCQNALQRTWDPGFTSRVMSRVCRPEWKNSWDQPDEKADAVVNVSINQI